MFITVASVNGYLYKEQRPPLPSPTVSQLFVLPLAEVIVQVEGLASPRTRSVEEKRALVGWRSKSGPAGELQTLVIFIPLGANSILFSDRLSLRPSKYRTKQRRP